ncbi:MAG: hypothetical protein ACTS8S_03630 [Giesbergeria sp.]
MTYIPATDGGLEAWALNFDTLITAAPTTYGLTAPQAATYAGLYSAWNAAYIAATTPSTRTKPAVAAKDSARLALVDYSRELGMIVQAWPSITPTLLGDLGLTVRDTTPTPIPAPTTVPLVSILAGTNLALTVRYADELTPSARKKPFGATAIELWAKVDDVPPVSPADTSFLGLYTRNPIALAFGGGDGGKLCTIYGRWVTRRGLVGPWSLPASMTVPSGV